MRRQAAPAEAARIEICSTWRDLVRPAVVELRRPRRRVVGDLCACSKTPLFWVGGDAGRAKRVVADLRLNVRRDGPAQDYPVRILLPERLSRAGPTAGGPEQPTIGVAGDYLRHAGMPMHRVMLEGGGATKFLMTV